MNEGKWQPLARSTSMLVFVVAGSACDGGHKPIGALDDGVGASESGGDGEGDSADEEMGETGEACLGDGDAIECTEPQGVSFDWNFVGGPNPLEDALWTCAANVEPVDGNQGYFVRLTHCRDSDDQPQPNTVVTLGGDGPPPEFENGEQPLTEFRYIHRGQTGQQAFWIILRPVGQERISLLGFKGHELIVDAPDDLSPLSIELDDLGCTPQKALCDGGTEGQSYRIGVAVGDGCTQGIVADGTSLLGLSLGDIVYDVLVKEATAWDCGSKSGNVLDFVIVGRTP